MEIDVEQDAAAIHRQQPVLIERYGGHEGGVTDDCIESKLALVAKAQHYLNDPTDFLFIPSYGLVLISRGHCYIDGNKRLGWYAFTRWIAKYGYSVSASDDEAYAFVKALNADERANPQAQAKTVVAWATPRLRFI